jgi:hypothetical protein
LLPAIKIIAGIRELMKIWGQGKVSGINNTGNNLMPVTTTLATIYRKVSFTNGGKQTDEKII